MLKHFIASLILLSSFVANAGSADNVLLSCTQYKYGWVTWKRLGTLEIKGESWSKISSVELDNNKGTFVLPQMDLAMTPVRAFITNDDGLLIKSQTSPAKLTIIFDRRSATLTMRSSTIPGGTKAVTERILGEEPIRYVGFRFEGCQLNTGY